MKSPIGAIAFILAILLVVAGGIWIHFAAPCGWFAFSKASDIPGRCLTVVRK